MINEALRKAIPGAKGAKFKSEKGQLALGGLTMVGTLFGIEMVMSAWGYEPEEWGRKWVRVVNTPEGEKRSTVTISNPLNKMIKYFHISRKLLADDPEVKTLASRLGQFKWDLTPAYRIALDLVDNRQPNGRPIYKEFDNRDTKLLKSFAFAAKEVLGMYDFIGEREQRDLNNVLTWMAKYQLVFVYGKGGVDAKFAADVQKLTGTLRRDLKDTAKMEGITASQEAEKVWVKNYMERIKQLQEQHNARNKSKGWKH
jgi:hypothetical protein